MDMAGYNFGYDFLQLLITTDNLVAVQASRLHDC
jgi:hypothetical protein